MDLANKVGILTGASRGIGPYLAEDLAKKGVDLALAARSPEGLEKTAEDVRALGARVITVPTDVTKRGDLENLVARTTEELGPADLLVNNAGVEKHVRFGEMSLDDIESIMATNVLGLLFLTRLVVPSMIERRHGHIANIASAAGKTAVPYQTVYASSKNAVIGFSWSLREELRPHGIGVSVVCPGYVTHAGMYADWKAEHEFEGNPPLAGTTTPEKVSAETIRSIERNRADVVVAPPLVRIADVVSAVSPELAAWVPRRTGMYRFLEKQASKPS